MKKPIGIVGSNGTIKSAFALDTPALLSKIGNNSGNLVFQASVQNMIDEPSIIIGDEIPWDPSLVAEKCRLIVVPSANFISETLDLSVFFDFLAKTKLPLVFLGLGSQANKIGDRALKLHDSSLQLIELIKDRAIALGLRGGYTQDLLKDYGVTDTLVTGCPSNFLNPDRELHRKLETKWQQDVESFITTGDEPWPKNPLKKEAERKLIGWVAQGNSIHVQQSVAPLIEYIRRSNPYQLKTVRSEFLESLRQAIAPDLAADEFKSLVTTTFRIYYSIDQWQEDASHFDLSVGLRLHGNMVSWQSGTPAIWVYHDSRTQELSETMALPRMSLETFLSVESIQDMKPAATCDFDLYADTREVLRSRIISIFERAQIKYKL